MTAGAGARRWANDYGDIPRWYWLPRKVLVRQARRDPDSWRRGSPLWPMFALAVSL